jgi:hypothetical protein
LSDDRIAATVGGRPIRLSDVEARASILRARPALRHLGPAGSGVDDWILRWAVQQLVGEAVLDCEIRDATTSAGTHGLDAAIQRLVRRVTEPIRISEHEVRSHYERNLDRYRSPERRRVSYVALTNKPDAVRARRRLIASRTERSTRADRNDVMDLRRGDYAGEFEAAVFAARSGDVVGPTRTEHGWLVARVDEITAESTVPYAVARSAIAAELLEIARARAFDDWLDVRRRELGRVAPDYEHPGHPLHGQLWHRH